MMSGAKTKGSIVVYSHFFTATALMSAEAKAELWDALGKYINGEESTLTDAMAMMAWQFIRPQLDRDAEKWQETCAKRSEAGRIGMRNRWQKHKIDNNDVTNDNNVIPPITNVTNDNNVIPPITNVTNDNNVIPPITNDNKPLQTITNITDNDNENEYEYEYENEYELSLAREHIARAPAKEVLDSAKEDSKVWTLDDFREAAKDPSVSLPESDVAECYDFYAAQGFVRGNGQPIVSVAPLLRNWKRKRGEFEGRQTSGPQPPPVDEYSLQRAFEYLDGHFLGDYPDDPKGFDGLKQWAQKNGVYDRLHNRNDNLYRHVFKTGK